MQVRFIPVLAAYLLGASSLAAELHAGRIKGDQVATYIVAAKAGQQIDVRLKASHRAAYFNVQAVGAIEADFVGSLKGAHYAATVPADASYRITIYLMRSAARRNAATDYQLKIDLK